MREVKQASVRELIDNHLEQGHTFDEIVSRFRNSVLVHALARTHGNITHASRLLHVHRNSVDRWMKEFNLKAEEFRERESKVAPQSDSVSRGMESQEVQPAHHDTTNSGRHV